LPSVNQVPALAVQPAISGSAFVTPPTLHPNIRPVHLSVLQPALLISQNDILARRLAWFFLPLFASRRFV
jgi:hypothetical protein